MSADLKRRFAALLAADPDLAARALLAAERTDVRPMLETAADAAAYLRPMFLGLGVEHLVAVALDRRLRVISSKVLTTGNDGFCIVCPKQIYRWALQQGRSGAHSVMLAHNHPSGNPEPSPQDVDVTRCVVAAGRVLGIPLVDHFVITDTSHASMAERGML